MAYREPAIWPWLLGGAALILGVRALASGGPPQPSITSVVSPDVILDVKEASVDFAEAMHKAGYWILQGPKEAPSVSPRQVGWYVALWNHHDPAITQAISERVLATAKRYNVQGLIMLKQLTLVAIFRGTV
jgi:hypothetical protein